jgi:AcrR family transcriptional regulator
MMAPSARLTGRALYAHPLAAAVVAEVAERGFPATTVKQIVERAGVERAEFYRLFDDKPDAVARVFDAYIDDFQGKVKAAYESAPVWPDSLRAAAYAAMRWIIEHPEGTRFGMVSVLEAGERARLCRERVFIWSAELIEDGRQVAPDPEAVPEGAALMAIGAVVEILARQSQGTVIADPVDTVPKMMYGAVRPYLGEEVARRELEIRPPLAMTRSLPFGGGAAG